MVPRPLAFPAIVATVLALLTAACGGTNSSSPLDGAASSTRQQSGTATAAATGNITVFAAASLTESFTRIGKDFEADNPDVTVTFNFAASSALAAQILQGAPADVFASADDATMKKLVDAGGNGEAPVTFARNKLTVIVGKGNPAKIESVKDLTDPDLIVVLCGPQVPIGAYSAQVFRQAGITVTPKSLEADVKSVVTKVTAGEADAGIVYATDIKAAGDKAEAVAIPDALNVVARYPMAVTSAATNAPAARLFVDFVTGAKGQTMLASYGFGGP